MTTRTHLSIGEVLSLLTDDFPDLTITKIRFLESQGLINPERTASGYRKFYDFDIERLRWILRQQRENFLPLKVIKDRLDRSEGKLPADDDAPATGHGPAQVELDLARDPGSADPPPVWMADHAKASPRNSNPSGGPGTANAGSDPGPEPQVEAPVPAGEPEARVEVETSDRPKTEAKPKSTTKPKPKGSPKTDQADGNDPAAPDTRPRSEPSMSAPPKSPAATGAAPEPEPSSGSDVSDVSLTRSELLDAAHLDDRQLTSLESFGIVVAADDLDDPSYGAEALVCARQAKIFLDLGVEPRHLRAFKVAADREAGLYEQLVLPLLRQRNPAARSEATQIVRRLTAAGATLHAALLQQSMRGPMRTRR